MTGGQRLMRMITDVVVRRPWLWRLTRPVVVRNFDRLASEWDALRVDETRLRPIDAALAAVPAVPARVLDLGTGTGAIAVAIASMRPDAQVWALDRSAEALAIATRNAARLLDAKRPGGALALTQSDWYDSLDATLRFDLIVSNPPYIASGDPHLDEGDLRFEPRGALTDEADGLSAIRAILAGAPTRLAADGVLWIEHGYDQAEAVRALLTAQGFAQVRSERDLAGIERISGGRLDT
jgi:release factor glutamine methyltransferase